MSAIAKLPVNADAISDENMFQKCDRPRIGPCLIGFNGGRNLHNISPLTSHLIWFQIAEIGVQMMDDMHEKADFDVTGTVTALDSAKRQHLIAMLEVSPFSVAKGLIHRIFDDVIVPRPFVKMQATECIVLVCHPATRNFFE